MSNFLKEFKEFACRGNVVDMAVGVTIGAAFGKVVTSFIEIFLNPILEKLTIEGGSEGIVGSLVRFAAVILEFILIAFFLFLVVKAFNKAREAAEARKKEEEEAPEEPEEPKPTTEELLGEILEELKKKN